MSTSFLICAIPRTLPGPRYVNYNEMFITEKEIRLCLVSLIHTFLAITESPPIGEVLTVLVLMNYQVTRPTLWSQVPPVLSSLDHMITLQSCSKHRPCPSHTSQQHTPTPPKTHLRTAGDPAEGKSHTGTPCNIPYPIGVGIQGLAFLHPSVVPFLFSEGKNKQTNKPTSNPGRTNISSTPVIHVVYDMKTQTKTNNNKQTNKS